MSLCSTRLKTAKEANTDVPAREGRPNPIRSSVTAPGKHPPRNMRPAHKPEIGTKTVTINLDKYKSHTGKKYETVDAIESKQRRVEALKRKQDTLASRLKHLESLKLIKEMRAESKTERLGGSIGCDFHNAICAVRARLEEEGPSRLELWSLLVWNGSSERIVGKQVRVIPGFMIAMTTDWPIGQKRDPVLRKEHLEILPSGAVELGSDCRRCGTCAIFDMAPGRRALSSSVLPVPGGPWSVSWIRSWRSIRLKCSDSKFAIEGSRIYSTPTYSLTFDLPCDAYGWQPT
ncbi:hypothetical protein QBC33DRAFT_520228 [Phialemonium atrogriseum]|uniref:Uncharacterized protein n=1 Tax=Phialemonium atrogriseum TaxID=1093897 RepID=A0AAJ0BQS2_9PEZI|nr:uncharacterized protein QBC33DRAFT_520228 [Phialemonium atrogriseum]KAK1761688.1 hypothetical protein QBC33DRAFT_520228 [Phialemonium atrogriseum]